AALAHAGDDPRLGGGGGGPAPAAYRNDPLFGPALQGRGRDPRTPRRLAQTDPLVGHALRLVRGGPFRVAAGPRRLRPTAEIHADAILVGDPGRAMALAQVLTEGAKMANHARGLWGYSGTTPEGHGLTVQATGTGGPRAA